MSRSTPKNPNYQVAFWMLLTVSGFATEQVVLHQLDFFSNIPLSVGVGLVFFAGSYISQKVEENFFPNQAFRFAAMKLDSSERSIHSSALAASFSAFNFSIAAFIIQLFRVSDTASLTVTSLLPFAAILPMAKTAATGCQAARAYCQR